MKLYDRLIIATFLRHLGYAILGSLILFSLVDLFDHLGSLLDNNATLGQVGRYYFYRGAWILDVVLPVSILLSTLFTVGSMARYLELTALFASGLGLLQVTRSLLVAGVVFCGASLAWHEYVLPEANIRRWQVWEVEIHKKPDSARPTRQIVSTGADGKLYYARRWDPATGEVTGLKVVQLQIATVQERLDAERAIWQGDHWLLRSATRRRFVGEREEVTHFDELVATDLALTPSILSRREVRYENMNISQLIAHQRLVRQIGGDATAASVDIQFQLAFPLVNLIVVFLGVILSSGPRKTTIASGFGWTLAVGIGYYLLMNLGRALGQEGVLPPVVAGWGGNLIYALVTWSLYLRARR